MFRKKTVLEGYYVGVWETGYLVKDWIPTKDFEVQRIMDAQFREHLQSLLKPRRDTGLVFLEDLLPKQVYQKMLKEPQTKFRFKIVVEVEEVCPINEIEEGSKGNCE